jgi:hypothetical protein
MEPSFYSRLPALNYATQWELRDDFRHKFYQEDELTRAGGTASPYFFLLSTSCAPGTAEYEERRAAGLLGHVKLLDLAEGQHAVFDYSANNAYVTFDQWYNEQGPLLLRRPRESLPPLFMELVFGIHDYYLTYREIEGVCCEMGSITPEDWREAVLARAAAASAAAAKVSADAAVASAAAAAASEAAGVGAGAGASASTGTESEEEDEEGEEDDDADVGTFSREAEEANLAYSRTRKELVKARRALRSVRMQMSRLLETPRSFHEESWAALVPCHERLIQVERAAVQAFEEAYFRLSTVHGMRARASTLLEALDDIWLEV